MNLYPSIASSNSLQYGSEIERINEWKYVHLDIEDGNFTPNITFGLKTAKAIISKSKATHIQVHLMTTNPMWYVQSLADYGATEIIAHIEALSNPLDFLNLCNSLGLKAGFAINTRTDLHVLEPFYEHVDTVLIMTSEYDGKSEEFFLPAFNKALDAAEFLPQNITLVADGGLTKECVLKLSQVGYGGVVLGRLVFSSENPLKQLNELSSHMRN